MAKHQQHLQTACAALRVLSLGKRILQIICPIRKRIYDQKQQKMVLKTVCMMNCRLLRGQQFCCFCSSFPPVKFPSGVSEDG